MKIVCIGDHCCPSILLRELDIKDASLPFDWTSRETGACNSANTNVETISKGCCVDFHIELLMQLMQHGDASSCASKFVVNSWLPHDTGTIHQKIIQYTRRFQRLFDLLQNRDEIVFLIVTRFCAPNVEPLRQFKSRIVVISGNCGYNLSTCNTLLFRDDKIIDIGHQCHADYSKDTIIIHVPYNRELFYDYDYIAWRPQVKICLEKLFL